MATRKSTARRPASKSRKAPSARSAHRRADLNDRIERAVMALEGACAAALTVSHAIALTSLPRATGGGVHEAHAFALRRSVVQPIEKALEALGERP